jgi:hypothetical protein
MIDPAGYADAEARAARAANSWTWQQMLSTSALGDGRFPLRVNSILDLKPLVEGMNHARYQLFLEERAGLRESDLAEVTSVLRTYAMWYLRTFNDDRVILPFNTLMAYWVTQRKLSALLAHSGSGRHVLEIGGGAGMLAFFVAQARSTHHFTQIEIAPSFYVLQSLVNAHLFGTGFDNRAVPVDQSLGLESMIMASRKSLTTLEPVVRVPMEVKKTATLYPWWTLDEALAPSTTYDVVISNGNTFEMTYGAFLTYYTTLPGCLAPHGVVLLQDLGAGRRASEHDRLAGLIDLGYRPLVFCERGNGDRPLANANVLLVRDTHPLWDEAARDFETEHFPSHVPLVRAVFGLDEAPGRMVSRKELIQRMAAG